MARRGFSCPNCHTWFEGEGNHPRCPLCGKRASPRDLLDDRGQVGATVQDWLPSSSPGGAEPRDDDAPADYELPAGDVPGYEAPREIEVPRSFEWDATTPAPDYETARQSEPPASSAPEAPRKQGLGDRIGPFVGLAIFVAIIGSRICRSLTE